MSDACVSEVRLVEDVNLVPLRGNQVGTLVRDG